MRCDQEELPRLARPKGCCNICYIRGEQSGRTTGRLGSTGLRAMPSEGRHSRHSGASTTATAGLSTISDDYGPAAIRRSMDLAAAAGARATRMSRLRAGDAAGRRGPERRRATGPTTTRPQELTDASVREHGTRRAVQVNSTRHALGIHYSD